MYSSYKLLAKLASLDYHSKRSRSVSSPCALSFGGSTKNS